MKSLKKLSIAFVALFLALSPVLVFANPPPPGDEGTGTPPPAKYGLDNPLNVGSLDAFLLAIVDGVVQVGFYLVVIFIVFSGFLFVKARGNPQELEKAKQAFLYTVIGAAILLGASLLANVIDGTINQIKATSADTTHLIS